MKIIPALSMLVILLALAACAQGETDGGPAVTQPVSQSDMGAEPASTPSLPQAESGSSQDDEETDAQTDGLPDKVLTASTCCGMVVDIYRYNYIPDAQVWGDGRILWIEYLQDGSRLVQEGWLTPQQLADLLEEIEQAGFFTWENRYSSDSAPSDLPEKCISIQTRTRTKQVCEYYSGAPQAFHTLYEKVSQGAGLEGQEFIPETGFLTAYPAAGEPENPAAVPQWQVSEPGVSLREAEGGVWVEGTALQTAWEIINADLFGHLVYEDNQLYQLSVQVPGVSFTKPPQP